MNFGMPGLVSDSLLDKLGNAVITQRLLSKGRSLVDFIAIDRLTYAQLAQVGSSAGRARVKVLIAWKVRMQSLGTLAYISYEELGLCGYELATGYMMELELISREIEARVKFL